MILVDSSVWISHLRGHPTPAAAKLAECVSREPILVGDLILLELLQGARDDAHAARMEHALRHFPLAPLLDPNLVPRAAWNDRKLRSLGITLRKTADLIVGTFCIEHNHVLLHEDGDFAPMAQHLGLKVF